MIDSTVTMASQMGLRFSQDTGTTSQLHGSKAEWPNNIAEGLISVSLPCNYDIISRKVYHTFKTRQEFTYLYISFQIYLE